MNEVKIRALDLHVGMFVIRLDNKEWTETSFPLQGVYIENDRQILKIAELCSHVYVDMDYGGYVAKRMVSIGNYDYSGNLKRKRAKEKKLEEYRKSRGFKKKRPVKNPANKSEIKSTEKVQVKKNRLEKILYLLKNDHATTCSLEDIAEQKISPSNIKPFKKKRNLNQEIHFAKQSYIEAKKMLNSFSSQIKANENLNTLIAEKSVHNCMLSVLRTPDALLLVSQLYKEHLSIWEHSMRVCVLAITLGRCLRLNENELIILGLCGLLHDIGALVISKEMLQKSDNQVELLQIHTALGHNILLNSNSKFKEILAEVAYNHHEYINGSGFTRGLKGNEISIYAKIICILDFYVSLTCKDNNPLTHYEAVLALLSGSDRHFEAELVNSFIYCVGTYPVGCFVEMNTGEIAMVVEENIKNRLKPKIMVITDSDKQPCTAHSVNLADSAYDPHLHISAIIPPDKYGINYGINYGFKKNSAHSR